VRLASGADERVRLTGVDTPETKDPRTVVEAPSGSWRTCGIMA
jgi:endonuclease YncB( thermonuclease family)